MIYKRGPNPWDTPPECPTERRILERQMEIDHAALVARITQLSEDLPREEAELAEEEARQAESAQEEFN